MRLAHYFPLGYDGVIVRFTERCNHKSPHFLFVNRKVPPNEIQQSVDILLGDMYRQRDELMDEHGQMRSGR